MHVVREAREVDHPDQRVVRQHAGQTPSRITLHDAQEAHDFARFRRAGTPADAEQGAEIAPDQEGAVACSPIIAILPNDGKSFGVTP